MRRPSLLAAVLLLTASAAPAQAQDYRSVDGIMTELYASVTRAPGEPFPWERLRAIMLPGAIIVPQIRMTDGETRFMNIDQFIEWIDSGWRPIIGTDRDRGFFERQINLVVDEYGDVANAFSTYEKGPYEPRGVQARGLNAVQLVKRDGRWWILSITWDEENAAGPLPPKYRGS